MTFSSNFAGFKCLDFYVRWIPHVLVFLHSFLLLCGFVCCCVTKKMFLKNKLGCFFFFRAGFNCLGFYTRWIQHVVDFFLHFCCCYVALFAAMQLQHVDLIFIFARFNLWLFFCIFIGFAVTLFGAEYDYVLDGPGFYASVYPHWLTWPRHLRTTSGDFGRRSRRWCQHRAGSLV